MRYSLLVALVPCALLAQTAPADGNAFQKLPPRLDWIQSNGHSPQGTWSGRWFGSHGSARRGDALAMAPERCAIPLLRAPMPEGITDRMALPARPSDSIDPRFVLPAPPVCEERKP
jgi:hypothetical protein